MVCHRHGEELSHDFKALGRRLNNWNRWGADDRIGTLNHITPERLVKAAQNIRSGKLFDLAIPLEINGIQLAGVRNNPVHLMSVTPVDMPGRPDGLEVADDYIAMPLQSATQWDGLGHVGYDGLLYNNVKSSTITTRHGSKELSIDQIAVKGIVGQAVLLDIAATNGVEMLDADYIITAADLERAEKRQGIRVQPGDVLLVRTGWIRHYLINRAVGEYWNGNPGLDYRCTEWLFEREVAAVASDNWCVEVAPPLSAGVSLPFHCIAIRDMGMTLGEIFNLEALSEDCAADGTWACFLTAPPLKVVGGVGTAVTPIAIK